MAENDKRSKGTVKWFNGWKGFGFITPDEENSEDLFVHQTSINFEGFRTLYDGQRVEFDVEIGDDGRTRACNVDVLRNSGNRGGRGGGGRGGGRSGGVECYNCGRFGHLARDCYHQGGDGNGNGGGYGRGGGRGGYRETPFIDGGDGGGEGYGRSRRGGGRRGGGYGLRGGGGRGGGGGGRGRGAGCFNCGEEGHFARDCSSPQN